MRFPAFSKSSVPALQQRSDAGSDEAPRQSGEPVVSELARFRHDSIETFVVEVLVTDQASEKDRLRLKADFGADAIDVLVGERRTEEPFRDSRVKALGDVLAAGTDVADEILYIKTSSIPFNSRG
jgi:hypothetical protein